MRRIATFNVNGVNGRLPVLLKWLSETDYDIVCLQELKTSDGYFRRPCLMIWAFIPPVWKRPRSYSMASLKLWRAGHR
ncbi:endonuclease/exonuclease/phosphatase family protein [Mesorhizobium sp. M0700]|uniref:endonuclease/exonuclease/phosphatase family protein n=1 Tax=Mesorhizobium sp. M0700 TaxID=2956988 RepID=UPI0033393239